MSRTISVGIACALAGVLSTAALKPGELSPTSPPAPSPVAPSSVSLGDLNVRFTATAEHAHWHHPGVRNLDPAVFGTVDNPLGTEFSFGVPLYDRNDDGQGNWTTTALPVAESNNATHLPGLHTASLRVLDRTPTDQPSYTSPTMDELSFECSVVDPFGRQITIRANQALPKGPFTPFFGGVGTNTLVHGQTGIGSKLTPRTFAYCLIYAKGEVLIDGQLLPGNDQRLIHVMVCQGTADDTYSPGAAGGTGPYTGSNDEVDPDDLELHVHVPPTRFTPNPVANSPVVGVGTEWIHLMFEEVTMRGSTINGTITR